MAREHAIRAEASPLRVGELRGEHDQRPEHDQDKEHDHASRFHLEVGEGGALVKDSRRDESCQERALSEKNRSERVRALAEERQAARPIGMGCCEMKRQTRYSEQQAIPDEEAEIPAEQNELED